MSLNTMDNEKIRREYEIIGSGDEVKITVMAKKHGSKFLPDVNGDVELNVVFRSMGVNDFWKIERSVQSPVERNGRQETEHDTEEMQRQILKHRLSRWNLDIPLEFDEEESGLTDRCLAVVLGQPAPLIRAFLDEYHESYRITQEEEKKVDRQCAVLFSRNSRGVDNATEAVTLFCVLSNMWDKFGLNRFDLQNLSYKEFVGLRLVLSHEIEKHRAQTRTDKRRGNAQVAGPGGRSRPSRGVVIEEH